MSETQEEAVTLESTENVVTETAEQSVIYCGPTLPRQYGLSQYRIFNTGLPEHIEQLVSKCAALGSLIVPVEQLAQTRIALSSKGSAQSSLYQLIVATFNTKAVKK